MEPTHLLLLGAPRSGTTLLATMISRHSEIAIMNEDRGWAMRRILGKAVVGNKRCVPNQIELKKRGVLHFRFLKSLGLAMEYQSSQYSIEEYLGLPNSKSHWIDSRRQRRGVLNHESKRKNLSRRLVPLVPCR